MHLSLTQFYCMDLLLGQHVLVCSDNMCIIVHINKQGRTHFLPLPSLRAMHITGILNGGADLLSRGFPLVRELRLRSNVVE